MKSDKKRFRKLIGKLYNKTGKTNFIICGCKKDTKQVKKWIENEYENINFKFIEVPNKFDKTKENTIWIVPMDSIV